MAQKKNRRNAIVAALAVLVVALAVGGTVAWLTANSHLSNNFTVGGITDPEEKPDPNDPDQPGGGDFDDGDESNQRLDGNLYESKWVPGSALKPGSSVDKNPNVGIGPKSEDAYVFLFVKNNTMVDETGADKLPYFTLNENWYAIAAGEEDSFDLGVSTAGDLADATGYTEGLFMYSTDGNNPAYLIASDDTDAWTGEAFSDVWVPTDATYDDFVTVVEGPDGGMTSCPTMEVYSFVYAANEDHSNAAEAIAAARAWANGLVTDEGASA